MVPARAESGPATSTYISVGGAADHALTGTLQSQKTSPVQGCEACKKNFWQGFIAKEEHEAEMAKQSYISLAAYHHKTEPVHPGLLTAAWPLSVGIRSNDHICTGELYYLLTPSLQQGRHVPDQDFKLMSALVVLKLFTNV